jgi:hypothetical protein
MSVPAFVSAMLVLGMGAAKGGEGFCPSGDSGHLPEILSWAFLTSLSVLDLAKMERIHISLLLDHKLVNREGHSQASHNFSEAFDNSRAVHPTGA